MADEFFETQRSFVQSLLIPGEDINDIEMMYSIVVKARREQNPPRPDDGKIGLWCLCFFAIPIKSPRMYDDLKQFRETFRGINVEQSQQERFRRCLKAVLLDAESVDDLEGSEFNDLFNKPSGYDKPTNTRGGDGGATGGEAENITRAVHTQSTYMTR